MKLNLLKSLMNNENKKNFYFLIFLNFLNFIMEVGAISCLAIFGSLLINKNYINEKFNISLESFINGFDPIFVLLRKQSLEPHILDNLTYRSRADKILSFKTSIKIQMKQN